MKIILSATTSWNLFNSRLTLAKALRERGDEVIFLSPYDEFTQRLLDNGFRWEHFPLEPRGKNIFKEVSSIIFLIIFYRREKPDIVNHFTPKGVIYGSLAAKIAGVKRIFNTITGLGYVFSERSKRVLRALVTFFYPIALSKTITVFQNPDNQRFFDENGIVSAKDSFLIRSSGVNIERFSFSFLDIKQEPIVLFVARFVEEKGIRFFVEASRILKDRNKKARFVLAGRPEKEQPTSIRLKELYQWAQDELIEWWGWYERMEEIYPKAHIVCLPTYYMEGVPKTLIEAAACGRPLIATDVPGCREIVHDGENGILVNPRNAMALADAIEKLSENAELCVKMGQKSREIAVKHFSAKKVNSAYLALYQS
ncbi:MAG: glycosyltransferase family 4 protein [Chloroflexi bacterium]|nr:glycosyltransferase family 4 protein [Chloroflexota bacterium]